MKRTTRCIVCATDFSPNAARTTEVAAALAVRLGVKLVLVHAAVHAFTLEGAAARRGLVTKARGRLRREAARIRLPGLEIDEVVVEGRWAERALEAWLAATPPLLTVVSSVSKTAFDRWTLGSVSEHIAEHTPAPTLVVRDAQRLLQWAQGERCLRVVVGVDFTLSSDAALAFVKELKRIGACAVTVAHVNWPPDMQQWSPGEGLALTTNPPATRRRLVRELKRKIGRLLTDSVDIHVEPNWGRPDAALVGLAGRADADIVVVGTHQRHGFERLGHASVSRGVLRHTLRNVVCVPVPAAVAHGVGVRPSVDRVLVATDLSPAGDQALPWAYALAAPGGTVTLVHVLEPAASLARPGPRSPAIRATAEGHRRRAAAARDTLAALVPPQAAAEGVRTEIEIIDDRDAAHGIGMAARRAGADVLCLTVDRHTAGGEMQFGSIVQKVIAQNRQPVLLVRPEAP